MRKVAVFLGALLIAAMTAPVLPEEPAAGAVRGLQAKFLAERAAVVKSGAAKRFVPILFQKADSFGKRADAFLQAGRLPQASEFYRLARWELPYQRPGLPEHVGHIIGGMRLRHTQEIADVAFSPDGKLLATAGKDRLVKLWDMANGPELVSYAGHGERVRSIAFSPDGKTLASAGAEPDIRLWDPKTGKDIRVIKGKGTLVNNLAYSRDGKYLVVANEDKAIRLYDAASGTLKREIADFGQGIRKVTFSADGSILAAGVDNGQIRLWEYPKMLTNPNQPDYWSKQDFAGRTIDLAFSPNGRSMLRVGPEGVKIYDTPRTTALRPVTVHRLLIQPSHPNNPFTCALFARDGKILVTGGQDGVIRLWDSANGRPAGAFERHDGPVSALAFNHAGTMLASASADYGDRPASADHTARLWPYVVGVEGREFKGHDGPAWAAAFSPDGQRLVSASSDRTVKIWDVASAKVLRSLTGHDAGVTVALFHPNGTKVLSGGADKVLRLWDAESGKSEQTFRGHDGTITSADFHPSGRQFVSGGADKCIKIWDTAGKLLRSIPTPSIVTCVAFSPDGKQLASGHVDQVVRLWDANAKETHAWTAHGISVSALAYSPNGKWLASAGADHLVRVWSLDNVATTPITLAGHTGPVSSVAFRKDSLHLASCGSDQLVKLWKLDGGTGREIQTYRGHTDWATSVAFSRDGFLIASASVDRTIRLWEINSRDIPLTPEHSGGVQTVAVSPDGTLIATGSTDKTIRLWDRQTGRERHTLIGHSQIVLSVTFSPDGKTLVSTGADRTIKLWNVATGKELPKRANFFGLVRPASFTAVTPDNKRIVAWLFGTERFTAITVFDMETGNEVFSVTDTGRNIFAAAFTPAADKAALGAKDGSLRLYDLEKRGQMVGGDWFIYKKGVSLGDLAFTPDGKTLIVGSEQGDIAICDFDSRKVRQTFKGHKQGVVVCVASLDGKRFATAGADNIVKLWEVATGKELRSWDMHVPHLEHSPFVASMSFTPDSRQLLTANADTTLYVLELP